MGENAIRLPTIAFIGLGNMGLPMSGRLLDAGYSVIGFDPNPQAREIHADQGGTTVESAAAAVRSADIVILMLPNSNIVESVLAAPAMKQSIGAGTTIVDMSSSDPLSTRRLAAELRTMSVSLIDAPVSGGVSGAKSGTLTIMVGGSQDGFIEIRPIMKYLGTAHYAGEIGCGHAIKAINNLLSATHLLATTEAVMVGQRFGLDPTVMVNLINISSGRSGSTDNKFPNFILSETFDSGFGMQMMLKDMKIAVELAHQLNSPSKLADQSVALWKQAANALPPTADHTEIARWATTSKN